MNLHEWVLQASDEEIHRSEWQFCQNSLDEARRTLEEPPLVVPPLRWATMAAELRGAYERYGARHGVAAYLYPAIDIATDRAPKPPPFARIGLVPPPPDVETAEAWLLWEKTLPAYRERTEAQREAIAWVWRHLPPQERVRTRKHEEAGYFIEGCRVAGSEQTVTSPSGRWRLRIDTFQGIGGGWAYTRGQVFRVSDDAMVAEIHRNYGDFLYQWVEEHPNGHDYLVAGFDYQGQTFVELDTGMRRDHLPEEVIFGGGFCWIDVHPSPDRTMLAVDGCFWAAPPMCIVVDFTDPMSEHPPIALWAPGEEALADAFKEWRDDNVCIAGAPTIVRRSDGADIYRLPGAELSLLYDGGRLDPEKVETTWKSVELPRPTWLGVAFWHLRNLHYRIGTGSAGPEGYATLARLLARLTPEERAEYDRERDDFAQQAEAEGRALLERRIARGVQGPDAETLAQGVSSEDGEFYESPADDVVVTPLDETGDPIGKAGDGGT